MKAKINIQEVGIYRIRIDYIKFGHEGVQLLIEYYNSPQNLHIRFTLKAPLSCLTYYIPYYCYVFQPLLNASNEDPRSLFIEIFGQCSAQFLVINHRGYVISGFPSQLSPLS